MFVGNEAGVLNVESGDSYTTLQTYLMPLNRIFTKGKKCCFLSILSQFLKAVIINAFYLNI